MKEAGWNRGEMDGRQRNERTITDFRHLEEKEISGKRERERNDLDVRQMSAVNHPFSSPNGRSPVRPSIRYRPSFFFYLYQMKNRNSIGQFIRKSIWIPSNPSFFKENMSRRSGSFVSIGPQTHTAAPSIHIVGTEPQSIARNLRSSGCCNPIGSVYYLLRLFCLFVQSDEQSYCFRNDVPPQVVR